MRALIVVGDPAAPRDAPGPRRDYHALADAVDAEVLDAGAVGGRRGRTRGGIALARAAAAQAVRFDAIYCDSEHIGLPLAFLLRGRRPGPRLTMIAHYLTPLKKRLLVRALRLHRRIDAVVVHSRLQAARARSIGFNGRQVVTAPYQVDDQYWRPEPGATTDRIVSAGREFRDYPTLLRAVDGLDVPVHIAAGSQWSTRRTDIDGPLRANVTVAALPYDALRDCYASARFVVVPLHDVDFQAGIITILEAMAMGKAVIVSRTSGQTGTVSGALFRDGAFSAIGEEHWPEQTGMYVPPADPAALRGAIRYLLDRPEVASAMGRAGRACVEQHFSLERFVRRLAPTIAPAGSPPEPAQAAAR